MAVAWPALRQDFAIHHVQRGKQRRRAVADVIVRDAFYIA